MQIIIDHDYLGPLCLQFSGSPTVADVKSEITERTGLPIKEQLLHRNGKKVSNLEMIFHFLSIFLEICFAFSCHLRIFVCINRRI